MYDDEFRTVETVTRRVSAQMTRKDGHMATFRHMKVETTNPNGDWDYWDMVPVFQAERPGTVHVY